MAKESRHAGRSVTEDGEDAVEQREPVFPSGPPAADYYRVGADIPRVAWDIIETLLSGRVLSVRQRKHLDDQLDWLQGDLNRLRQLVKEGPSLIVPLSQVRIGMECSSLSEAPDGACCLLCGRGIRPPVVSLVQETADRRGLWSKEAAPRHVLSNRGPLSPVHKSCGSNFLTPAFVFSVADARAAEAAMVRAAMSGTSDDPDGAAPSD